MDFNIIVELGNEKTEKIIERAYDFGYRCIALNTIIESAKLQEKNVQIPTSKEIVNEGKYKKLKLVNRITGIIEDSIHGHHLLRHTATMQYDIVAVQPVGEKMLQHACNQMDVDIISIDLSQKLNFSLKRTYIGLAIERGISFEILYSPCLRDHDSRRMIISNSQILSKVTKGRNIILSSGAREILELRSVEDISNLGLLFGLNANQAKAAVQKNGELILKRSATRHKTGWGFVSVQEMFKLSGKDKWLINACRIPNDKIAEKESGKRKAEESLKGETQLKMAKT